MSWQIQLLRPVSVGASPETMSPLVTVSSSYAIANDRRIFQPIVLTGDATITLPPTSVVSGNELYNLVVELRQDGTGNRTVTWTVATGDILKWMGSVSTHLINGAPNSISRAHFLYRGGSNRIDATVYWVD